MRHPIFLLFASLFFLMACNQDREMMIHAPASNASEVSVPGIRPVRQDGDVRLIRRVMDSQDPCLKYLDRDNLTVLASCIVVLDGLVSPAYRENVSEVSLCVMKQVSGSKEYLALEGSLLSENGEGGKVRFYFSKAEDFKKVDNLLKVSFVQGKDRVSFEYVDLGLADFPLLKYTRRSKVFRKKINNAAFECLPEYIPE